MDLPDLPAELTKSLLTEAQSEDVVELYQAADTKDVATPGGVVSDSVQVYWTNQRGPSVATGMVLGTASGNLTTQKVSSFGIAARAVPSWLRSEAATRSAILFSTGSAVPCHAFSAPKLPEVYAVPKFGGGDATVLNEGFIVSRGLAWDGSGTVFVADQVDSLVA